MKDLINTFILGRDKDTPTTTGEQIKKQTTSNIVKGSSVRGDDP